MEKCTRCGRTEDRIDGKLEDGYCHKCLNLEPLEEIRRWDNSSDTEVNPDR